MSDPIRHFVLCAVGYGSVLSLDRNSRRFTVNYLLKPAPDRLLDIVPGELDKWIGGGDPKAGARN